MTLQQRILAAISAYQQWLSDAVKVYQLMKDADMKPPAPISYLMEYIGSENVDGDGI